MHHSRLDFLEITPSSPQACVIWLHGLGADGHDFMGIVPELQLPEQLVIRFIFPHAPIKPVTINSGQSMRAWYDISQPDLSQAPDREGILASVAEVQQLIDDQQSLNIPSNRILLAGFSQGGAIALQAGLRYTQPLAGIIALSTYLPLSNEHDQFSVANKNIPIFMAHGEYDPVVDINHAQKSSQFLAGLGYSLEWQTYAMEHNVCLEEIQALHHVICQMLR